MGLWTPTERRREQIVDAALELLAGTSLEAVSTREVARVLRLSQPALFRHFRTREELLLAVVARARANLEGIIAEVLAQPASALALLRRIGETLLGHVERAPGLPRLLFGAAGPPGPLQEALRLMLSMQTSLAAELVRQGQREATIAADVAPEAAATLFVGLVQGLVLDWELRGRPAGLPARFPACFDLWVRGLVPAPPRAAGVASGTAAPAAPTAAKGPALQLLDVRPLLSRGVDPLETILGALATLPEAGVLAVLAPFHPTPLVMLLRGRGHAVQVEALEAGRFLLLAVLGGQPAIEDLRDLEPPEPLERVLTAASSLEDSHVHLARTPRSPRLLAQRLRERAARFELLDLPDGSALIRLVGSTGDER